jgi:N6-L-threonylcarbamoyladenine synthase
MKILAIETSCDETGIALVEASGGLKNPKFRVLKNLVSSQIPIHRPFGGVVPNLAKREHLKNLPILLKRVMSYEVRGTMQNFMKSIDLITVTVGPGLEPALWTGITFAEELAKQYKKPLIGANHLEGHLYSFLLSPPSSYLIAPTSIFPSIALIVSGGHTILLRVDSFSKWKRLGETRDDAAGEAFDKVARLLDLPYPGGPEVEKLALRQAQGKHQKGTINFPRPMLHDKNYDFSFSGLKTAVLYYTRDQRLMTNDTKTKANIAASFQQAAIDVLATKTIRAAREFGAKSVILCGGVAANKALRRAMSYEVRGMKLKFFVPDFKYNLDNGAMIGAAGYMAYLRKKKYPFRANGGLEI